jgi:hypothetical protein
VLRSLTSEQAPCIAGRPEGRFEGQRGVNVTRRVPPRPATANPKTFAASTRFSRLNRDPPRSQRAARNPKVEGSIPSRPISYGACASRWPCSMAAIVQACLECARGQTGRAISHYSAGASAHVRYGVGARAGNGLRTGGRGQASQVAALPPRSASPAERADRGRDDAHCVAAIARPRLTHPCDHDYMMPSIPEGRGNDARPRRAQP